MEDLIEREIQSMNNPVKQGDRFVVIRQVHNQKTVLKTVFQYDTAEQVMSLFDTINPIYGFRVKHYNHSKPW